MSLTKKVKRAIIADRRSNVPRAPRQAGRARFLKPSSARQVQPDQ